MLRTLPTSTHSNLLQRAPLPSPLMNPVCRLYKRALRCSHDWIVDRIEWRVYALAIRAAFDRRKDEQDPAKVAHFIKLTEELLTYWKHDVPYICNHSIL